MSNIVNLSKVPKVILTKGQTINLTKDGTVKTASLNHVFFGAKWGSIIPGCSPVKSASFIGRLLDNIKGFFARKVGLVENVDLDASLLLYDKDHNFLRAVYYGHQSYANGAIEHSGDDITGTAGSETEWDNETISMQLNEIPQKVAFIVAVLNSYRHHRFDSIPYMKLRIYTGTANNPKEVLCAYNVENNESFKDREAIVLGYFYRSTEGWKFKADGRTTYESSLQSMVYGSARDTICGW